MKSSNRELVDRLAAEGTRFTSCYSVSGVCTPSRAGLMTGCYPKRVSLHQNDRGGLVLQHADRDRGGHHRQNGDALGGHELEQRARVRSRGHHARAPDQVCGL